MIRFRRMRFARDALLGSIASLSRMTVVGKVVDGN